MKPSGNTKFFNFFLLLMLFVFVSVCVRHMPGYADDIDFWKRWAVAIHDNGISNVYNTDTNYLPLIHYLLLVFNWANGSTQDILSNINNFRLITLAFDCLGLWYVYKWMDRKIAFMPFLLLCILNIAYTYNSLIWGQVDGILATLVFISFYYAWRQRLLLCGVFFMLALCMKLQAIIFLPLLGLLCLQVAGHVRKPQYILAPILGMLLALFVILLPFMASPDAIFKITNVAFDSVDKYPRLSLNAMNFWYLVINGNPFFIEDKQIFIGGLTSKVVGLLLFAMAYFFALLPLIRAVISNLKAPGAVISKEKLWVMCTLTVLLFFFFNTQMHERYSHPAFIFIIAYAFYCKDFVPYVLFSMAYFLNLERVLKWLQLSNYETLIFDPRFIAGIYLIIIVYLFIKLYRNKNVMVPEGI